MGGNTRTAGVVVIAVGCAFLGFGFSAESRLTMLLAALMLLCGGVLIGLAVRDRRGQS